MAKKQPAPVDVHVGSRIRQRRIALGLSQEKVADRLGLTFQQLQKYEKGTNRVGASRLQQLANALAVAPAYFFEGAPGGAGGGLPVEEPALAAVLATRDGLALVRAFARVENARARRAVVELARVLAGAEEEGAAAAA